MNTIIPGADQMEKYLPLLEGKKIAIVANQTSQVNNTHLVDTLLSFTDRDIEIIRVFAPEHGFRGIIDDGVHVADELDPITGIPIVSLYGKYKKPNAEMLAKLDLLVFDIQDVGVRFYTFISTLHYVMEACAEMNIPVLVLDRPNPNASYIDGPVLLPEFKSFVGMHRIPVVYGLTIGEFANMINEEGWLKGGVKCDLKVISCENYSHSSNYSLPVKPSPNLPNDHTIKIYPSTCFFEGTVVSEGRGTLNPFEVYGHPELTGDYSFTPISIEGMEMNPKFKNQLCYGEDLRSYLPEGGWHKLELRWLLDAYQKFPDKENFFRPFFENLAGTDQLRIQIENGWNEVEIRKTWEKDLEEYDLIRRKYFLYE